MTRASREGQARRAIVLGPLLLSGLLGLDGCLTTPRVQTPLHESAQGVVALEELPDPALRGGHPVDLEPAILTRVLSGLRVQQEKGIVEAALTGPTEPMAALADREIGFLAPLLASALAQATPEEGVLFRLPSWADGGAAVYTEGRLYVTAGVLSLSLTAYRAPSSGPALLSRPSSPFARATPWRVGFSPEAAWLNAGADLLVSPEPYDPTNTVAIRLEALAVEAP